MSRSARFDASLILALLALLLAWDASGADLAMTRWLAGPQGFPWRDAWLTRHALHDGGRLLSGVVLVITLLHSLRRPAAGPSRAQRLGALGVVALGFLVVPSIKRVSATSCPWDLAEFGGTAAYVSHWQFGLADGGPGHCFPSGHAVAAFAFFAMYFLWRPHRPAVARAWLAATLVAGAAFGATQWLRGAHFPSHVLWSAWVCWTVAALSFSLAGWARRAVVPAVVPMPGPAAARPGHHAAARRSADRSALRRKYVRSRR